MSRRGCQGVVKFSHVREEFQAEIYIVVSIYRDAKVRVMLKILVINYGCVAIVSLSSETFISNSEVSLQIE